MGMIGNILGLGNGARSLGETVKTVAEVFVPNATRQMELAGEAHAGAMGQFSEDFRQEAEGPFDRFVNGLNRMPRPALALGTLALFGYAMTDPAGFSVRMQGLAYVPEPLWWLLGAIVTFYFGAREAHYLRGAGTLAAPPAKADPAKSAAAQATRSDAAAADANPALEDWRRQS